MSNRPSAGHDAEKAAATVSADRNVESDPYADGAGADVQVLKTDGDDHLKLARDGQTILLPQPTDDPEARTLASCHTCLSSDPLNWPNWKKNLTFFPLVVASLLTDFGMAYGVPLFEAQTPTFHMSLPDVAHSISGGLFLQGIPGLFVVPLVQRIGRLPVIFWSQFLASMMVMAAAVSPNYGCFTAFRALQGLVNTAPQIIGLSIIHDMFFFHERTRRINIWVFLFMGGPSLGPFISGMLVTVMPWRAVYGFLSGLYGLSAIIIVLFADETLYDRRNPLRKPREKGLTGRIKLLLGITGYQAEGRPTLWTVIRDLADIQMRPQIFFLSFIYSMILTCWVTGVTTTISEILTPAPYSFSQRDIALSFLGPLAGSIIGEIWGHWFLNWLQSQYVRRHNGRFVLENRLWGAWPPSIITFACLILYGQALQRSLPWIAPIFAWSGLTFALIAGLSATSAYALDCFPMHACLVGGILNMWRTVGGFCVNYFQLPWIKADGAATSFGLQAMIFGVLFIGSVVITQVFGKKWRAKYPPPRAEN